MVTHPASRPPSRRTALVLWWLGPCSGSCKEFRGGGLEIRLSFLWPCSPHKSDIRTTHESECAQGAAQWLTASAVSSHTVSSCPAPERALESWCARGRVFCLACTCHSFCGWPVVELVSSGLARTNFSICSGKRKIKNFNFQRGIFPVILNKFYFFVLGMDIGITSLAQMQIRSRKRNVDSDCNHVTMSHAIRCPGCRQRKM